MCVNKASAINLSGTEALEIKRYDLMRSINTRGTFVVSRACIPHLKRSANRVNLAEEITRIHCDATGVPPSFVNVMFLDLPNGRYFVAGKPSTHSVLNGAIRIGRDLVTRQRILRDPGQEQQWLSKTAPG